MLSIIHLLTAVDILSLRIFALLLVVLFCSENKPFFFGGNSPSVR